MTPTGLDEGILARSLSKIQMERKVIGAGQFHGSSDGKKSKALPTGNVVEKEDDLLKQLVKDARKATAERTTPCTPLLDVNRMIARSDEEFEAFKKADLDLLGAPAAGKKGQTESTEERLIRCGRLMGRDEVPKISLPTVELKAKEAAPSGSAPQPKAAPKASAKQAVAKGKAKAKAKGKAKSQTGGAQKRRASAAAKQSQKRRKST
eukprot:TRINITY_DN2811_c0_g3_i2.p1 TRINITY_DN2811_c0_g3~~TRINITY_DN2811_c0_g3_i2.p1  ORF type:complete len:207 (+),score=55.15 TRINITY_DN2811_c0_g3_i2:105-725(+)